MRAMVDPPGIELTSSCPGSRKARTAIRPCPCEADASEGHELRNLRPTGHLIVHLRLGLVAAEVRPRVSSAWVEPRKCKRPNATILKVRVVMRAFSPFFGIAVS